MLMDGYGQSKTAYMILKTNLSKLFENGNGLGTAFSNLSTRPTPYQTVNGETDILDFLPVSNTFAINYQTLFGSFTRR